MTIRANSVEVLKIFRASCRIDGCGWIGLDRRTYQEANDERAAHIRKHAQQEASREPAGL